MQDLTMNNGMTRHNGDKRGDGQQTNSNIQDEILDRDVFLPGWYVTVVRLTDELVEIGLMRKLPDGWWVFCSLDGHVVIYDAEMQIAYSKQVTSFEDIARQVATRP